MFQAKLQGWRRLAAGLMLVPGLTGLGTVALGLNGRAAAEDKPASVVKGDEARDLMRQAREAYDAKNFGKAKELAEKARVLRAPAQFFDDTPEDLLADIAKKSGAKPAGAAKPATTDPRRLVGMAKQSLESGDLDKAQDFATMAQANEGAVRWGLFDDTPASVQKDIQKAKTKRDQRQAEKLLADAKTLLERKAADKTERLTNLMTAEEKARQAGKLHGPYSVWDFGDRPEEIIADCRKIKDKERLSAPKVTDGQTADARTGKKPTPDAAKPVVRDPKAPVNDAANKARAVALIKEASALKVAINYPAAKEKLVQASKLNATFTKDEDSPESELSRLNSLAQRKINTLCAESKSSIARKDPETAKAKLDQAGQLAAAMNLDAGPITDVKASLNPVKPTVAAKPVATKPGADDVAMGIVLPPLGPTPGTPVSSLRPVAGIEQPMAVTPAVAVISPAPMGDPALAPAPVAVPAPRMAPVPIVTPEAAPKPLVAKNDERGRELLDAARLELRKDNPDAARKLVIEVINGPYAAKEEAANLLNTIEAEESDRKMLNARRAFENGMAAMNANNYSSALAIFQQVDPTLLNAKNRSQLADSMGVAANRQKAMKDSAVVPASGLDDKTALAPKAVTPPAVGELTGAVPTPRIGADSMLKQQEAMAHVQFQKLRTQGLKVESEATARFGKGETDAALQDLQNFVAEVRGTTLDAGKQNMLVRPIEARVERLKILIAEMRSL